MRKHRELTQGRITDVGKRMLRRIHRDRKPMSVQYFKSAEPVPFRDISKHEFH
ncbi:MAG: hypothetical protein U5O39_17200 [Gammaproteobacteria bacterium]|nr:hypothetical protein [Gammaproteobacteria bacterium]